jgi:hypothetical protein
VVSGAGSSGARERRDCRGEVHGFRVSAASRKRVTPDADGAPSAVHRPCPAAFRGGEERRRPIALASLGRRQATIRAPPRQRPAPIAVSDTLAVRQDRCDTDVRAGGIPVDALAHRPDSHAIEATEIQCRTYPSYSDQLAKGNSVSFLHKDMFGSNAEERQRFEKKAAHILASGEPLYLQLGFGRHPIKNFLNLDFRYRVLDGIESSNFYDTTFIFDWPKGIPVANDSVSFVFHEDMYEHLDQKEQYYMLAEVLRILKPGHYHRVNCPNLEFIMRTMSNFKNGHAGIHDEWAAWHHKNVPTKISLEEQARIVGYTDVLFNGKNQTASGVVFRERRPGGQYDQKEYNLFADLKK